MSQQNLSIMAMVMRFAKQQGGVVDQVNTARKNEERETIFAPLEAKKIDVHAFKSACSNLASLAKEDGVRLDKALADQYSIVPINAISYSLRRWKLYDGEFATATVKHMLQLPPVKIVGLELPEYFDEPLHGEALMRGLMVISCHPDQEARNQIMEVVIQLFSEEIVNKYYPQKRVATTKAVPTTPNDSQPPTQPQLQTARVGGPARGDQMAIAFAADAERKKSGRVAA